MQVESRRRLVYLRVRLASLATVLGMTRGGRQLLTLGPRTSRFDVFGGGKILLVFSKLAVHTATATCARSVVGARTSRLASTTTTAPGVIVPQETTFFQATAVFHLGRHQKVASGQKVGGLHDYSSAECYTVDR